MLGLAGELGRRARAPGVTGAGRHRAFTDDARAVRCFARPSLPARGCCMGGAVGNTGAACGGGRRGSAGVRGDSGTRPARTEDCFSSSGRRSARV